MLTLYVVNGYYPMPIQESNSNDYLEVLGGTLENIELDTESVLLICSIRSAYLLFLDSWMMTLRLWKEWVYGINAAVGF